MASIAHDLLPAEATIPTDRQRLFMLFFVGALVDLVVLGLFVGPRLRARLGHAGEKVVYALILALGLVELVRAGLA